MLELKVYTTCTAITQLAVCCFIYCSLVMVVEVGYEKVYGVSAVLSMRSSGRARSPPLLCCFGVQADAMVVCESL